MKRFIVISSLFIVCLAAAATQLSFNSGRQSKLMKYRVDVDARSMAAETLTNVIVRNQGMAYKRPGTEFIDDVNDVNDANVRLVPFEYAVSDAYVLEFTDGHIGFFRTTE